MPADADAVAAVHGEIFRHVRPAATLVVVAGLMRPSLLVEVEAEAQPGLSGGRVTWSGGFVTDVRGVDPNSVRRAQDRIPPGWPSVAERAGWPSVAERGLPGCCRQMSARRALVRTVLTTAHQAGT